MARLCPSNRYLIWGIAFSGIVHAIPVTLLTLKKEKLPHKLSEVITIEVISSSPVSNAPTASPEATKNTSSKDKTIESSRQTVTPSEELKTSPSIEKPEALHLETSTSYRKPDYPEEARLLEIEGTVIIVATIASSGKIKTAHAQEPKPHPILEESALEQIKSWSFPPSASERTITIPIKFELE